MSSHDPVPDDVRRELDRIRDRWRTLPIERARAAAPALAGLVDDLGARSARALGRGGSGPHGVPLAVLADALTVVVHDCYAAPGCPRDDVPSRVTAARRALP